MYWIYFKWAVLLIFAYCVTETTTDKSTTLNVRQRVAILRKQIEEEIQEKQGTNVPIEDNLSFEDNEYDHDRPLLTPIINKKKKKKVITERMTSKMTTVTNAAIVAKTPVDDATPFSHIRSKKRMKNDNDFAKNTSNELNLYNLRKPVEIFYRRLIDEHKMNTEVQWVHCQDLITPFLQGVKKELTAQNHLTPKSPVVKRLIHLLTLNTTMYTKEDIFSVLYQISNLQLRLFQWDVQALNLLFYVLIKEKKHTFANLKWGVRTHFAEWRLDISNVTNLLHQSRIFRPPCIRISDSTGSTKSNKVTGYPKKTPRTTDCDSSEDAGCRNSGR